MRLLVTRPEPEATRTAERLRAMGHEVTVASLMTITFAPPPAQLPMPAGLILTSQNGVRALVRWPQALAWYAVTLFAAGPATAEAARGAGFANVVHGAGVTAALAETVAAILKPADGPVIYVAARDRAADIAGELAPLGYDVRTVEAYRADAATELEPAVAAAIRGGTIDGILLYSRRTAETFRRLMEGAGLLSSPGSMHWYVISAAVAGELSGLPGAIHVADKPEEDSLLGLIPPVR